MGPALDWQGVAGCLWKATPIGRDGTGPERGDCHAPGVDAWHWVRDVLWYQFDTIAPWH